MAERHGGGAQKRVIVFSGGVGLGAYQAGAYARLHEAEGLRPDWLAGVSIGAVNAALIAGNAPKHRVERLRRFWDGAASAPAWRPPLLDAGPFRHAYNWMSVFQARVLGSPGLFRLRPGSGLGGHGFPSLYDLEPMRRMIEDLVDFDRLNGGEMRVSVVAADVASGDEVVFDTAHGARIEADHLLATCGFIPEFPPVAVDDRVLGDGALIANTPIDLVLRSEEAQDMLCFVLDLFARDGVTPNSLEASAARRADLMFSSQPHYALKAGAREARLRAAIARLGERLSPEVAADPDIAPILAEGSARAATLLYLSYRAPAEEAGPEKQFDLSRATLADRWEAGSLDMAKALRVLSSLPAATPGLAVHHIRR